MSGHPDMMDRVPGVSRPCIQKPFSLTALLATIERASNGLSCCYAHSEQGNQPCSNYGDAAFSD